LNEDLNPILAAKTNILLSDEGEVGFVGQVLNVLDVSPDFIDATAEGMRRINTVENNGTGTSFLFYRDENDEPVADWLKNEGIRTAGKTGSAEFCDNLSQQKGWCTEEKILNGEVFPAHS